MNIEKKFRIEMTSFSLHMMAMIFMLFDHMWITVIYGNDWMNYLGRLAFPIFAFMIVEGYMYTSNLRKYVGRMFLFALISEIPFNLVVGGGFIYPFHQNVLWTFLLGMLCISIIERSKKTQNLCLQIIISIFVIAGAYIIGILSMVDYHAAGILTVLVFFFFRGHTWYHRLGQLIGLYYINFEMLGGMYDVFEILGRTVEFPRQGFAIFALIPIWLYTGKRGMHHKWIQYFNYAFYPLHLLILSFFSSIF